MGRHAHLYFRLGNELSDMLIKLAQTDPIVGHGMQLNEPLEKMLARIVIAKCGECKGYQDLILKAAQSAPTPIKVCFKCRGRGSILGPSDSGYMDCTACDGKGS